ncbi:hypothetical protein PLICRDRAFT_42911 [Plicaturopsis crispa FD-325 SS-3]|nr:hypothetical protein PLICRDRAFT_42911 [Plicaturopsis crispa FD-325 SS-3]
MGPQSCDDGASEKFFYASYHVLVPSQTVQDKIPVRSPSMIMHAPRAKKIVVAARHGNPYIPLLSGSRLWKVSVAERHKQRTIRLSHILELELI